MALRRGGSLLVCSAVYSIGLWFAEKLAVLSVQLQYNWIKLNRPKERLLATRPFTLALRRSNIVLLMLKCYIGSTTDNLHTNDCRTLFLRWPQRWFQMKTNQPSSMERKLRESEERWIDWGMNFSELFKPNGGGVGCPRLFSDGYFSIKKGLGCSKFLDFSLFIMNFQFIKKHNDFGWSRWWGYNLSYVSIFYPSTPQNPKNVV